MITKHKPLLPIGSTLLEYNAAQALQQAVNNPNIIADLINPEKCPEHLLPYLAWAFSVDKWDEDWTEEIKRLTIKHAFFIHKHKGTIAAIKRVIEPVGYLLELKEWWQETPLAEAGTFKMSVEVSEFGLNQETYNELVRLIEDVKPVSRHLKQLSIAITPSGIAQAFLGLYSSEIMTIYPLSQ